MLPQALPNDMVISLIWHTSAANTIVKSFIPTIAIKAYCSIVASHDRHMLITWSPHVNHMLVLLLLYSWLMVSSMPWGVLTSSGLWICYLPSTQVTLLWCSVATIFVCLCQLFFALFYTFTITWSELSQCFHVMNCFALMFSQQCTMSIFLLIVYVLVISF